MIVMNMMNLTLDFILKCFLVLSITLLPFALQTFVLFYNIAEWMFVVNKKMEHLFAK